MSAVPRGGMVGGCQCPSTGVAHRQGGACPSPAQCEGSAVANGQSCTSAFRGPTGHCGLGLARSPWLRLPGPGRTGAGLSLGPWGWGGQAGQGRGEVLLARGRGRAAAVSPAPFHTRWPKRRSGSAVLGQWARVLRARGTWLGLRAKRILHPLHQEKSLPPYFALTEEAQPKKIPLKLKFT